MNTNQTKKSKLDSVFSILLWLLIWGYGVGCLYLYFMQSVQPTEGSIYFFSDLSKHISMIIDDGWYYSFTAVAYQVLYHLCGQTTWGIAMFLALIMVGTIWLMKQMLQVLFQKFSGETLPEAFYLGGALLLQFMMAIFWPYAGEYRYISYQSGNLWHNSTYLCMRILTVAIMIMYFDLMESYKSKPDWKKMTLFSVLLFICTGVKPSFLTVFAPIMALKLLWDLFHKIAFKNIFLFGLTVIPACLVVLWQNVVLFGGDSESTIVFYPGYAFSLHALRPRLAIICSVAFPISILAVTILLWLFRKFILKKQGSYLVWLLGEKGNELYFFIWGMTALGFAIAYCLAEAGKRSRDGNFLWGYFITIFLVNIISFWVFVMQIKKRKEIVTGNKILLTGLDVACVLQGLVLIYQIYGGVYFWRMLLRGMTYFM